MSAKRTCYIITPVENENGPVKRHMDGIINAVLLPVLNDDYEILVDYRIPNQEFMNKQAIQRIYDSDLVIANLSDKNPNVLYQLAFRHSIGTPVIMIAEEGTSLPGFFNEKTIFYMNDAQGVLDLIDKLIVHLESIDFTKAQEGPIYDSLRDTLKEECIVKKDKKEFEPLKNILKEDEIAEINETEYLFFRDILNEENINADTIAIEYDRDFLKKEIIVDNGTEIEPYKDINKVDSETEPLKNIIQENNTVKNEAYNNDNSIIDIAVRLISKMINRK